MADKRIKEYMSSLYRVYEHRRKTTQDALDLLSAHSTAGYAIVIIINTAAMLFKATLEIEFCYHFRPYYWKIMYSSAHIASLGLMFIERGTFFICSVISLALQVIWQYLLLACYGLVKLIVMLIAYLISAVVFTASFVLNNGSPALSGVARVCRLLLNPAPIKNLEKYNWRSPTFGVQIAMIAILLTMLTWRRRKRPEEQKGANGTPQNSDAKTGEDSFSFWSSRLMVMLVD